MAISTTNSKSRKRNYDEAFLKIGFIEFHGKPKCVLCGVILSAESMKRNKLQRHLDTEHPNCVNEPINFFERMVHALHRENSVMTSFTGVNKAAVHASYVASYHIAKIKKPHNIGENLILPLMKQVVVIMLGQTESKKLNTLSLSNDTVRRRIVDMSEDVLGQILQQVNESVYYSIQLDESTDIVSMPQLSVFIRYVSDSEIIENFLFCRVLPTTTTGLDIFNCLNTFFASKNIAWDKCVGICTDGVDSCTGIRTGVVKRIQVVAKSAKWTHCFIHREALAAKDLSPILNETMKNVVFIVNFVKARPLKQRLFSALCEEMGEEHKALLLYTEVRWLSRGCVLNRVMELRKEIAEFLRLEKHIMASKLSDDTWLSNLAYLC